MTSGADDALAAHELDLVTRAAQGDDAAFDRFFERNASAVQLLTERLLGPGDAADAVVVEAFEKTVRRLPLLGARNSSPALYVLSTARNGAYAALGRQRPTADGGPLGALLALPSRQRELLALRELGLPEEECAEVAGIEPREVGVQVARARLRLTDELEGLTLSTVFADDRAERLLAAEVVRTEGAPLPEGLEDEITRHANEDSRFAAALSAVRSPSRSVGQLPAVTGAARLATTARGGSVGTGRPAGIAAAGAAGAFAAGNAAAAAKAAAAATSDITSSDAPASPRAKSDPYDETIGDEMAWGIVDDDDDAGSFTAPTAAAGSPAVDSPTDGQWEDGAGAVSQERAAPAQPGAAHPSSPLTPHEPAAPGTDPSLADPFAGWDDALDWGEDDKHWGSGPAAGGTAAGAAAAGAAAQPADAAPPAAPDGEAVAPAEPVVDESAASSGAGGAPLEETRAFDAVAAGLVDPDPFPLPAEEALLYEEERRSPWRWVIWVLAFALLFVGVAFATATIFNARRDPSLPPKSTLDATTPVQKTKSSSSSTSTPKAGTTKKKSTTGSSSSSSKKTTSTSSSGSGSSSSDNGSTSSGTSSGSGTGSTSTGGSSGRSSSGTSSGSGTTKKTTAGTSNTGAAAADDGEVVSGETDSGGSVRGAGDSGGTTP